MKKSITLKGLSILIFSCVLIFLSNCKKEPDTIKISKAKVSGYVQKGPFVNGTTIQMYELNSFLEQTGKVFNTQINNNQGSFEINNVNLSSQYVQFSANGFYFNEISGELSVSPLNLNAVADISDISTVNVNILTHLEKARVEYLMDHGKSFAEAKSIAQAEVLGIFGYELNDMDPSEMLDMSVNKAENAILIAISVILQGDRSVGDLTELLANIITDIRDDGVLDDTNLIINLLSSASSLNLDAIRSNLQNRYAELGISVTIPDFEQYVYDFIAQTPYGPPEAITGDAKFISSDGAFVSGSVNAKGIPTYAWFEYENPLGEHFLVFCGENGIPVYPGDYYNINYFNGDTSVSIRISGLEPETEYRYRIVAGNDLGIHEPDVGEYNTFTTLGTINDIDGNIYKVVPLPSGTWMAENLKTTKYSNGDPIETTIPDTLNLLNIADPSQCKFQWAYDGNEDNVDDYGRLYTWYATTDNRGICPTGWHIPSDEEWTMLANDLGGDEVAGGKLKETGTIHWKWNTGATNETGFTALPGGYRISRFASMGDFGVWWSSSEISDSTAAFRRIYRWSGTLFGKGTTNADKRIGLSVRCIKDN